ncbi:MAG: hypothetical protein Q7T77_07100 [Sulfuricurvum sp.]|nr:hypothetical protein [Sulfuricurvum sp.]
MDFLNSVLKMIEKEKADVNMETFLNGKDRENMFQEKIVDDIYDLINAYSMTIKILKLDEVGKYYDELENSFS